MNEEGNASGNANLPIGNLKESQEANPEIGVPRGSGGPWRSRGYLPHFDGREVTQHVTFHLADSLPREALERVEEEIRLLPAEKQDNERRRRIEAWIDAGHGSCVLREPAVAALVQGAFLHFDGVRYRLLAWVVMPNHVHVLFQPIHDWTVARIVASWKKFTARRICDFRKAAGNGNANLQIGNLRQSEEAGNAALPSGIRQEANREIGGPRDVPESGKNLTPVWHREYWDRFIRNDYHFQQAVEYIHQNPVKAGLVGRPEEWHWSSAASTGEFGNPEEANQEIGVPIGRALNMLKSQIEAQGKAFEETGGFRERLTARRIEAREKDQPPAPECPLCGKPMRRRNSAKGEFWGCSAFPDCKGTRPM